MDDSHDAFLARWSRRKAQARQGAPGVETEVEVRPAPPALADEKLRAATVGEQTVEETSERIVDRTAAPDAVNAIAPPQAPPPTLADAAALTRDSDFSRFVAPDVQADVKNAALNKLFGDPHFNVMDGLDVYIDDYGKPDPLPASAVLQMTQAAFLGLVQNTPPAAGATADSMSAHSDDTATPAPGTAPSTLAPHEDADLRLQPHDAAGRTGTEAGAAADDGREL